MTKPCRHGKLDCFECGGPSMILGVRITTAGEQALDHILTSDTPPKLTIRQTFVLAASYSGNWVMLADLRSKLRELQPQGASADYTHVRSDILKLNSLGYLRIGRYASNRYADPPVHPDK